MISRHGLAMGLSARSSGRVCQVPDRKHPGIRPPPGRLARDQSRRALVLARGCRADLGRTPRPQPLRRNPLASRSRRASRPDRSGGLDDRAPEECPLPFRLVSQVAFLPPDIELWWVGTLGWAMSQSELEHGPSRQRGRVRFLGNVSDAELCRLYQMAGWSIYPSRYEGFGFPILDSLRHGTPVLASSTSSMCEFDHPSVYFFDPHDPGTVDLAWQRLHDTEDAPSRRPGLTSFIAGISWPGHPRCLRASPRVWCRPTILLDCASISADRDPAVLPISGPQTEAPSGLRPPAGMRVGIGPFTTQTASHNRGLGAISEVLFPRSGTRPGQQLRSLLRRGPLVRSTSEGRKRGNPPAAARASPRRGEPGRCSNTADHDQSRRHRRVSVAQRAGLAQATLCRRKPRTG